MIAKFFIVFLSATAGTFIGLIFSNRMTRRRKFFEELISFTNSLASDLKFKQSMISEIISVQIKNYSGKLKDLLDEYVFYLKNGGDLKLSKFDMSQREYSTVVEFFTSIGTLDLDTQLFVFENHKTKFSEYYKASEKQEKNFGKTAVKLGFLGGLAVGIMFI